MPVFDPQALARRQRVRDREQTRRFPGRYERKVSRMQVSPLAFLRGSAPLFYELVMNDPDLGEGPAGEGWIVGDAHLENFGAYIAEADGRAVRGPVFDLNDFDDCLVGPLRYDLLRLSTSLLLGARELGANGLQAVEMVDELVGAWCAAVARPRPLPPVPRPVQALLGQVAARSRKNLLDARTTLVRGRRSFVRGGRYEPLSASLSRALPAAFAAYAKSLPENERPRPEQLEILDAAHRIAGTGSLGVLRIAILAAGKGGPDGGWVFDLKEEGSPSAAQLGRVPAGAPAERVAAGIQACLARRPRLVGTTRLFGLSMIGRRLAPQEDRLDLARIEGRDLPQLARFLGALLGRAHRRGATRLPRAVPAEAREALGWRAIRLAGLHEAIYLAYCRLGRP